MPAPRVSEFQERPQLPVVNAPQGLPFLSAGAPAGSNEPGLGQEDRD